MANRTLLGVMRDPATEPVTYRVVLTRERTYRDGATGLLRFFRKHVAVRVGMGFGEAQTFHDWLVGQVWAGLAPHPEKDTVFHFPALVRGE